MQSVARMTEKKMPKFVCRAVARSLRRHRARPQVFPYGSAKKLHLIRHGEGIHNEAKKKVCASYPSSETRGLAHVSVACSTESGFVACVCTALAFVNSPVVLLQPGLLG